MKEEMKNGWANTTPLIEPTIENSDKFFIKVGNIAWTKSIHHLLGK